MGRLGWLLHIWHSAGLHYGKGQPGNTVLESLQAALGIALQGKVLCRLGTPHNLLHSSLHTPAQVQEEEQGRSFAGSPGTRGVLRGPREPVEAPLEELGPEVLEDKH